jgi:hypothetical protein
MTDLKEQEKIVDKYANLEFNPLQLKATEKEKIWIDLYLKNGNAFACVLQVWPERGRNENSAKVFASNLLKKFGIKKKRQEDIRKARHNLTLNTPEKIVRHMKDMYLSGAMTEADLVARMARLSESSISESTRFAATKELREWLKEAQSEVEANKLSIMEIEPLMVAALAELPKDKYITVLRECRRRRTILIKERNITYDAETIRKQERDKKAESGLDYDSNPGSGDPSEI